MLNKDALLHSRKPFVEVECPQAGSTVLIRRMTAGELLMVNKDAKGESSAAQQFRLVAFCLVDEKGACLFAIDELKELDADVYLALSKLVAKVNGLEGDAEKKPETSPRV